MTTAEQRHRAPVLRSLVVAVAMTIGAAACGSDDATTYSYEDIGDGSQTHVELIEGTSRLIASERPAPGDEISAGEFAVYRATIELYDGISIRGAIAGQAVADEDDVTRPRLEGSGLDADAIDQIFDDLGGNVEELPVDTFLKLPVVVLYIDALQEAFAPLDA